MEGVKSGKKKKPKQNRLLGLNSHILDQNEKPI
jgi:hypothetical protein